jgi:predicted kinase
MIINIAGTSGSGKTTLAKALIAQATGREDVRASDGKIVGALLGIPDKRTIYLVGRYQEGLQTCGCDTIKDVERIYKLVEDMATVGYNVVYEGLFVMNHTRGIALAHWAARNSQRVTVIRLTTPLNVCHESIQARRAVTGLAPLENMNNTNGNHTRAINYADKMARAGARVLRVSREDALPALLEALE